MLFILTRSLSQSPSHTSVFEIKKGENMSKLTNSMKKSKQRIVSLRAVFLVQKSSQGGVDLNGWESYFSIILEKKYKKTQFLLVVKSTVCRFGGFYEGSVTVLFWKSLLFCSFPGAKWKLTQKFVTAF